MAEITLYDDTSDPTNPNESDGETSRALATVFQSTVDTYMIGARWRTPTGALPSSAELSIWSLTGDDPTAASGTRLEIQSIDFTGYSPGDWVRVDWASPIALAASTPRLVQVWIEGGRYTFSSPNTWATPHAAPFNNNSLTAYDDHSNGRWSNSPASDNVMAANNYPGGSGYNFWVDIITDTAPPGGANNSGAFLPFFL